MTDQQKRTEIITLLTFLQAYVQNHVDNSFTDLTFNIEHLILNYINVFENDNDKYINVNTIKHNYPAVDLISVNKGIAIQVTTNADKKKVDDTIETYKKQHLKYKNLIIIGFVKTTNPKVIGAKVYGVEYLTRLATYADNKQLDELYELLQRQIPWNSLTPLDDKHCFEVIFDVINRSAIRDYTMCEGDFDKMADGLSEIKEIITTGKIKGKNIRAKGLVEFTGTTKTKLGDIEFQVSQILQICNSNKNKRGSTFLAFDKAEKHEIDNLKEKIISNSNFLSKEFKLGKKIIGSSELY